MGVQAGILELETAKKKVNTNSRNVSQAERGYNISLIRYKEGTGSQLEISDADLALRQARLGKAQSIYDYLVAKSNLKTFWAR